MIEYCWRHRDGQQKGKPLIWRTSNFISTLFSNSEHSLTFTYPFSILQFYKSLSSKCRCVRLARFENDRTISFIPPDGAFDLMTYRLSTQVWDEEYCRDCFYPFLYVLNLMKFHFLYIILVQVKPLIWVEAQIERHSRSRVEMLVKARSQFKERR